MQLAVFSSTNEVGFVREWEDEVAVAIFGSVELDLTKRPPALDATLTVASVFGSVKVIVPPGTRVVTNGIAIFGSARAKVAPGVGPELHVRCLALFGSVVVVEGKVPALATTSGQTFPF